MIYLITSKRHKELTKNEFNRQLYELKKVNQQIEYKNRLEKERNKYKKKIHIETSKLLAVYLFALLNLVIIYSLVAMWHFSDLSYLGVLISDIAAQVLIYAIYCIKAYNAKKSEEELKYRRERFTSNLGDVLSAGAECTEPLPSIISSMNETADNSAVG